MGTSDPNSPHLIQLSDKNLQFGNHQIDVLNELTLISGAEYSVQIFGQDRAGNSAVGQEINQIVYDIDPPILEIISPVTFSIVNHTKLAFSIGEKLKSLNVAWIDVNGNEIGRAHV